MNTHDTSPIEKSEAAAPGAAANGAGATLFPRTVIRGESPQRTTSGPATPLGLGALTDWFNVTFRVDPDSFHLEDFFDEFSEATEAVFGGMEDRGKGLHGYPRSFSFDRGQVCFAYGGQRSTALLSLPGSGCALVPDWLQLAVFLLAKHGAHITRWDGAVDDFEGEHSVDHAVELYKAGGFISGGRRPRCKQHGNWIEPDGTGRTFEVGSRQSGKLIRIYEKGKQLGDPNSLWVRWELELHNIDRVIPWDAVLRPGEFVAGAYPCLDWVTGEASRIRTIRAEDSIGYERLLKHTRLSCGRMLNVMMERAGSAEAVINQLIRPGAPRRLEFPDWFLNKREPLDE